MSDPYGRPGHGQQPNWGPQQQQQPAWGAPQPTVPPPSWAGSQPAWGTPPRRSRKGLWWALAAAVVAVLVAAGVTVFLLTRPVDPPTGVAAAIGDEGVIVSWEGVDGAESYEVHRGDELLGTTAETTYVDAEAPGGTEHRYAVTALDGDGDRSDRVDAGAVVTPLDPLSEFGASSDGADVYLDWEPVTGADRYEITRDGTLLDDGVTESPYLDEAVPLGDHLYELTAVDEDGEGSRVSIDLTFFSRGPWLEAYEIAEAFPELVSTEPGGTAWQDSTCERGTPAEEQAVVACAYPNGLRLQVLQYADAAARDAEIGDARNFGGPQSTWSYGDGPAEGDLVLSPPGPTTWRYITFYGGGMELFVLRVDWDGHSQEELDTVWFADAPF